MPDTVLSPDQIDAVLRDPQVPGDVRAYYVQELTVQTYLANTVFVDDGNGLLNTQPKPADDQKGK
jgi:hypothetical protein